MDKLVFKSWNAVETPSIWGVLHLVSVVCTFVIADPSYIGRIWLYKYRTTAIGQQLMVKCIKVPGKSPQYIVQIIGTSGKPL